MIYPRTIHCFSIYEHIDEFLQSSNELIHQKRAKVFEKRHNYVFWVTYNIDDLKIRQSYNPFIRLTVTISDEYTFARFDRFSGRNLSGKCDLNSLGEEISLKKRLECPESIIVTL